MRFRKKPFYKKTNFFSLLIEMLLFSYVLLIIYEGSIVDVILLISLALITIKDFFSLLNYYDKAYIDNIHPKAGEYICIEKCYDSFDDNKHYYIYRIGMDIDTKRAIFLSEEKLDKNTYYIVTSKRRFIKYQ